MLQRFLLSVCLLLGFFESAQALPVMRPSLSSLLMDVRALRAPCVCRVRVKTVQKRTVVVGYIVTSRKDHRPRKRRYDMPAIPKQNK